ncbi:hypothetical protein ACOSP7_030820 [Xanthoceras sorbifolium]
MQILKDLYWCLRPLAHRSSSRFSCSHAVRPRGSVDRASSRRFSRSSFCCPCVELQDWNNRRQFTPPSDFHADGVNEFFNSQAVTDGSRANEILKQAPFLLPFTSRVKIFHISTVRYFLGLQSKALPLIGISKAQDC